MDDLFAFVPQTPVIKAIHCETDFSDVSVEEFQLIGSRC
jgi:hypothetical protein